MSEDNYQNIIQKTFQDPLTDLLLKNSVLTRTQFETLVIDMLTDIISDEKVSFQQKSLLRNKKTSRGSFSRSLSQARSNVVSSVFTIVLLSYIGVFDERPFDEYYVLAEKLKEYATMTDSVVVQLLEPLFVVLLPALKESAALVVAELLLAAFGLRLVKPFLVLAVLLDDRLDLGQVLETTLKR